MGTDLVVVGGGLIGLASAWRSAERGLRVVVVDPSPASGASHVAAGMLAPVTELHFGEEPLLRLNLAAAQRYPAFVAELEQASGLRVAYRTTGTLAVALDTGDRAELARLQQAHAALGLRSAQLTGRECRRLEPLLAASVAGGLLVEDDHSVDNRRLAAALLVAVERSGATVVRRRAAGLHVAGGRVAGVVLDDGTRLAGGRVLLAAGCWSAGLEGLPPEAAPPVRPVKGQLLRLRVPAALRPFLSRTVRGTVRGQGVYLVPREDGELVLGATTEELGFDTAVTAGGVYTLLRDAHALLPSVTELTLVETLAGLRPGSPDNAPVVGETVLPGLLVATGHHRNGVLLTPVTADAVAALATGGDLPEELRAFGPGRFTPRPAGAAR